MRYRGHFSDGKSATRRQVSVELTTAYLQIVDDASPWSLLWPYGDLELIASESDTGPVRLTRRSDNAPRLHIADSAFLAALLARSPTINPRPQRIRRTVAIVAASLVCLPPLAGAVWFGLPQIAKPLAALVPHSVEERIGETVLDILVGDLETCDNEAGRLALDRLVNRLWVGLDKPVAFDVRVVRSPLVNAVAAPGGHILVFSGLLDGASGPEELAGVLAHEIGHVVHRHSMQALIRHFALSVVVTTLTGNDWGLGSAAQLMVQFAYSREAEAEADATAITIVETAGLRSDGLARFFARIQATGAKKGDATFWRYVGTHPPTEDRIAALNSRAAQQKPAGTETAAAPALSAPDWRSLKAICKKD
jgi:predicted Zn-dependent protease